MQCQCHWAKEKGSPRPALFAIIHLIQYTQKTQTLFAGGTEGKKNRLSTFVFVSPFLSCFFIPTFAIFFPNAMPVRILSVTIGLNGSSGVERDNRFV
jgi:hypothetical protein